MADKNIWDKTVPVETSSYEKDLTKPNFSN